MENIFNIIKNSNFKKSILWHCASGKDRCGLVAAFLLYILDVDMNTIFDDYIKSNKYVLKKAEQRYKETLAVVKDKSKAEVVRKVYSADKSYLQAAFDEINKKYNGLDYYIESILDIKERDIEKLRKNCLY